MARKSGSNELDKIVNFIVAIIIIYILLKLFTPVKQVVYPQPQTQENLKNKFGTLALTVIVWFGLLIVLVVELVMGIRNPLFIYPTVVMFVLFAALSYKLTAMNKKQIEELIK